ncbi:hypothetical protein [Singulisphaera sp. PoT]|uniref:hypothetical protein n=1 Tax=Singulisphaera sp. PoT TaxID=3411797 RepID=UPI003BF5EB87
METFQSVAGTSDRSTPTPDGSRFHCRRGFHELIIAQRCITGRLASTIQKAEAEFALIVEGPWIVLAYRFGDSPIWSYAEPFNWHLIPERERFVPAEVSLTAEAYSRLWLTLWITLIDADTGEVRALRSVALRPSFHQALSRAIREQSRREFSGAAADHALAWLNHGDDVPVQRAVARSSCAAAGRSDAAAFTPLAAKPVEG